MEGDTMPFFLKCLALLKNVFVKPEGLQIASDHPGITYSLMAGVGILAMKRKSGY